MNKDRSGLVPERAYFLHRPLLILLSSIPTKHFVSIMMIFSSCLPSKQIKQPVPNMEDMRLRLIQDAELPDDSKMSILVSKRVQDNISYATAYGADMYCLLLNNASFNPWIDLPVITFTHASGVGSYPETKLPETRHVLGIEANAATNTVVMGHFMYTNPGKVIRVDIFSIDANFNAKLVQVLSTQTECAGSGLMGTFASPNVNQYIALWGDLTNDDFFDTFKVHKVSDVQTGTDSVRIKTKDFRLKFMDLGELYPIANDAVYNCHAYGADHKHPNCLAIMVYHADLKNQQKPRIVFHTVIQLPFHLYYSVGNVTNSTIPRYSATIRRMQQKEDRSMVCLVRVLVNIPVAPAVLSSDLVSLQKVIAPAPTNERDYKEKYVYLLLSLPHHTVLDIFVPSKYEECAIDTTGEYIVRFLATPDVTVVDGAVNDISSVMMGL